MLKKFPLDKINGAKNTLFFLLRAPTHHRFTFNLRFLYELKHKVHFSKTVCWIFHFRLRFVFIKVVQQNALTLKRHNSFQNKNDRQDTYNFAPRFLIFKLQEEV